MIDYSLAECGEYNPSIEGIKPSLAKISNLPGCRHLALLPDAGASNHESPYGVAAAFDQYVVPQLLGRVVACGMGLVEMDIPPERLKAISDQVAREMGEYIHQNKSHYRFDYNGLNRVYREGPACIQEMIPELLDRVPPDLWESVRLEPFLHDERPLSECVPPWALRRQDGCAMPMQSIRKNHFVELGYLLNQLDAGNPELNETSTFCAYHFETPYSGSANSVYSGTRRKDRTNGALTKFQTWKSYIQKYKYHRSQEHWHEMPRVIRCFLRHVDFTPVPIDSRSGQRYLSFLKFQINLERVARLIFPILVVEAIEKILNQRVEWRVLFEANHNGFEVEEVEGEPLLVSRKNLVRANASTLGFIAGMYNRPSIIVKARPIVGGKRWMNSYDHGIGNQLWRESNYDRFAQLQTRGDVSRYEDVFRQASSDMNQDDQSRDDILGCCSVYRHNVSNRSWQKERHDVKRGAAIEHVVKIYNEDDSPVRPIALLAPFINYKEV